MIPVGVDGGRMMIPWLQKLLWDESAFTRYARAAVFALAGMAATNQLPSWFPPWAVAPLMGLGGLMGAGDRNAAAKGSGK